MVLEDNNYKGIVVKFDNSLDLPEIPMFLNNPDSSESDDAGDHTYLQQTKTTGILAPLVKVNNYVVPTKDVLELKLSCKKIPKLSVVLNDSSKLIETFDRPGVDNGTIQVQIIPSFENAYKKINLLFYITSTDFSNEEISIEAIYSIPGLHDNMMKSFGRISTYTFFENVSKMLKLGFASNITSTDDERWIYVPNKKISSILSQECSFGGSKEVLLDWWIDYWNNINLVDIRERNESIDKNDDMKIWIYPARFPDTETGNDREPFLCEALITNNESFRDMQTYVSDYEIVVNSSSNLSGTDRIIEFYMNELLDTDTFCIQNKDVVDKIYTKYDYVGENFGDYQYLLQSNCRSAYLRKINSQKIVVNLFSPNFALFRGSKVNFYWYTSGEFVNSIKYSDIETNIESPSNDLSGDNVTVGTNYEMVIDKQVSGQYYIEEANYFYSYNNGSYDWYNQLILTRPADQIETFNWNDISL